MDIPATIHGIKKFSSLAPVSIDFTIQVETPIKRIYGIAE
jgi:hypothetical protein